MIFYINKEKRENAKTIIETIIEVDFSVGVINNQRKITINPKINIKTFSEYFSEFIDSGDKSRNIIDSFDEINNIKNWINEFLEQNNFIDQEYIDDVQLMVLTIVKTKLTIICKKLGLLLKVEY